ncbi:MAG: hypothetical protein RSE41_02915 [Clostridia bacterium]
MADDIFNKIKYSFDNNPFKSTSGKWVTVVIVFVNGNIIEKPYIENPWPFINALKKNVSIKTAYIKKDKNNFLT